MRLTAANHCNSPWQSRMQQYLTYGRRIAEGSRRKLPAIAVNSLVCRKGCWSPNLRNSQMPQTTPSIAYTQNSRCYPPRSNETLKEATRIPRMQCCAHPAATFRDRTMQDSLTVLAYRTVCRPDWPLQRSKETGIIQHEEGVEQKQRSVRS